MKRFLCPILIFAMLAICLPALAEYDPVIVQVGRYAYPRSLVLPALQSVAAGFEQTYGTLTDEYIEDLKAQVIDAYVRQGVMENMLLDLKLDDITPDDMKKIGESADALYAQALEAYTGQLMAQYQCSEEKARKYAPALLDLIGMDMDAMEEKALSLFKQERLTDYVNRNEAPLTDADVDAWYEANLVAPSRSTYENDVEAFEREVVFAGADTCFIPNGYRSIRTIALTADEEAQEEAALLQKKLDKAREEAGIARRSVEGYELLMEDTTEAQARLSEAEERISQLEAALTALYETMAEPFADTIRELRSRLDAGEDFMALIKEYDQNPDPQEKGYPVCADSILWESAFRDAAMSLEKIGDYTGPVLTAGGPVFLYYEMDVTPGAVPMADRNAVRDLAQADARQRRLDSAVIEWKKEYEVVTFPDKLILY